MSVFRACIDRDLPALKAIWLSCFDELEEAADLFFQQNRSTCHAYACEEDGRLVCALYLIDGTLGGVKAHYLCGAATLPAYRDRGFMGELIAYALKDAKERGDRFSLLYPASESLYGYYARFGYQPSCAIKSAVFHTDTNRKVCEGLPDLQELQEAYSDNETLMWDSSFIRFAADYYGFYGAKTVQSTNVFAFFQPEGDFAEVYYAIFRDIEELKALFRLEGVKSFRLSASADNPLFEGEITKPSGMILPLCGEQPRENVYIGITLH